MPSIVIGRRLPGPEDEEYVITDFLGRGAFGEVYRARGEQSGSTIAVKLLPVAELSDDTARGALLNEIRAAQEINHPNVVRVLSVHDTDAEIGPYTCMEYISGGTLSRLIRSHAQANTEIPLSRGLEMMIDIAQGMRAVNERLIHRDLKPDNILIEGKSLKIADFGISKFVDESTRLHTFKGGQHVAYMAPEGWAGEKNTYKLDVYSAGLVFFEILTLTHPLISKVTDRGSIRDWELAHLYEVVPDPRVVRKDLPLSVVQLISRMAAKRPQERPAWEEVLKVLSGQTLDVYPGQHAAIGEAVASAVAKRREQETESLETARKAREAETERHLYSRSCLGLLERFQAAVDRFNSQFQLGRIESRQDVGTTRYTLPTGNAIEVAFFEPRKTDIKIRGAVVIGGGWIGLLHGRSANLVLLKEGGDDLYGRWIVCEIGLMALADPRKLIGRFGIAADTVVPFGFKDAYFYEQIYWAQGGLHAFTYNLIDDADEFFAGLMLEGCK